MNILHFAHTFIPNYGGTTSRLINLLSDKTNTHLLHVPMPTLQQEKDSSPVPAKEKFDNIEVSRHKLHRKILFRPPIFDISGRINSLSLSRAVGKTEIDIVHGHNPAMFARAALYASRKLDKPFVYEAHRLAFDSFNTDRKYKLPRHLDSFLRWCHRLEERTFFCSADAIIVQTEMHKDRILKLFKLDKNHINVIPMGVDIEEFDPESRALERALLRERLKWNDKIIIMFNGYLGEINGLEFFLKGVQGLDDNIKKKIKAVILGRGPLQKIARKAQQQQPELFEYMGLIEYSKMPAYYAAADVIAIPLPSTLMWECNNPTKLLEAMAMKKIVLGSDVRGITDLLTNGHNGITYKKDDAADFIRQTAAIVDNIDGMDELKDNARDDVVNSRDWKMCRRMLRDVYDFCVNLQKV